MANCITPTQLLKKEITNSFFDYFIEEVENSWFVGIGNPIPWAFQKENEILNSPNIFFGNYVTNLEFEDGEVPSSRDTDADKYNFYRTCTAMKRITSEDISFVIPKNPWKLNTVYQPYRHDEEMFLENKKFYIFNPENRCVYKCIENISFGASAGSGITEGGSQYAPFSETTEIIDTQDGYKWKLIYKLSAADEIKFSVNGREDVDSFIPVKYIDYDPDTNDDAGNLQKQVQDAAVNGSLSSIYVNPLYTNVYKYDEKYAVVGGSSALYLDSDVAVGASSVLVTYFGIDNTEVNSLRDMLFYVVSGPGAGQARPIKESEYTVSGGNKYFTLKIDELDIGLSGFVEGEEVSRINILPQIKIFGDGTVNNPTNANYSDLTTALGIPKFDSDGLLKGIDLLDIGKDYSFASVTIPKGITTTNTAFPTVPEDYLRVSLSPAGGHGSNAISELGTSNILLKTRFTGTENGVLNASNDFRQIGIVRNPELTRSKVKIRTVGNQGSLVATGDSATLEGTGVTAYGIVANITSFTPNQGYEFLIEGLSGDRGNYTEITTDSSNGTLDIDPYDGINFIDVAGRENIISRNIIATTEIPAGINPRDFAVGYGNKELGISPSLATGVVAKVDNINANQITIENISGSYKENEIIRTFTRGGTSSGNIEISEIYDYATNVFDSVYRMTTKLYLTSQENQLLTVGTFVPDRIVYGFEDTSIVTPVSNSPFKSNAFVFDWSISTVPTFTTGVTNDGMLEVVGARSNSFEVGDYILYYKNNVPCYATINRIVEPDVKYGTGEVVYVQNFSGIERYSNNEEEINLIIGL